MLDRNSFTIAVLTTLVLIPSLILVASSADSADQARAPAAAVEALHELAPACAEEGGELWGTSLCGPMLIVDPKSRVVTANTADGGGLLQRAGDLYVGVLPQEVGLANTALEWSGTEWSMVKLPLSQDPRARRELMLHEAWHRLQDDLGLPARGCDCSHLEETRARLWMRLEWRALARALAQQEEQRQASLADALLFRFHRQLLFPGSARAEACLELHEGLAQYTGMALAYGSDLDSSVVQDLAAADRREHLSRSFAYLSGPAYGALLDDLAPGWRRQLSAESDLGTLAAQALPVWSPDPCQLRQQAEAYGYHEVHEQEKQLEHERDRRQAELRASLVDAPGLVLPLVSGRWQFGPTRVVSLAPHGTVYLGLSVQDTWGRLDANEEALLTTDYMAVSVPGAITAVDGDVISGDTWRLFLAEGWRLETPDQGPPTITQNPVLPQPGPRNHCRDGIGW